MPQEIIKSADLLKSLAIASDPDKVPEMWGFCVNDRVSAQAVATLPVSTFGGSILCLWSDGTATVKFDHQIPFDAERELVHCGRVDLHYLTRISS
ncbi:hypothetical protein [Paraburkholderia fungorum]|uniref:hypothetical protein n=1 Tax=Paraburkholderia fungorum TaxID=134537 RepID=UPI0009445D69|nr:hypothetical protein [Paraburkholderia fungorum]